MTDIDLSEFEALGRPEGKCKTGIALQSLSPAQRRKVNAALAAPRITTVAIAKWFKQHGHEIAATSVQRHRRGECHCDQPQ